MDILLVIIIFVVIIFIRKLWIEYKDRENSFRRANQAIDRELLNRKYIESEILLDSGQFKKYTPLMSAIPAKYSLEQSKCNDQKIVLYTSMSGERSVKEIPSTDNIKQTYKIFLDDINKCHDLHKVISFHFESNKEKNYSKGNRFVIAALKQDIDNVLSFLHDLYEEQQPTTRFKFIDINKFKSEEFERYLNLKVFYLWLVDVEKEICKKTTNKSTVSKSISKKEIFDETKSTEKESNNGVTNVKRRRTRASNSSTKKSTNSEQKDI